MNGIVEKRQLAAEVFLMKIHAPLIARKRKAGQFIILRAVDRGERIPLTIADADTEAGTITIIFQVVGLTTSLLSRLEPGDELPDVAGPLGVPTHVEQLGTVGIIGGGIGIAVAYPIAKAMKEAGNTVVAIIGARTRDLLILEDELEQVVDQLIVTTDDGSYKRGGMVTEPLRELLEKNGLNQVVAIGPVPMMRAVSELTRPFKVKTLVSLNPIMVDGTGMCGACRVSVGGKIRFACVEGPEFDGHEVDFADLTLRLRAYREQELMAFERHRDEHGGGVSHG